VKIIIYLWKSDNQYYTDTFTAEEAVNCPHHIGERFEFFLDENEIKEQIEALVASHYWYDSAVLRDEGLKESMIKLSHRIVNDMVHTVELSNFKKFLNESARKIVIDDMVDELRQRVIRDKL